MQHQPNTVGEAAKKMHLAESTLWKLIQSGEIESVKIAGRRMILDSQIDAYIDRAIAAENPPQL